MTQPDKGKMKPAEETSIKVHVMEIEDVVEARELTAKLLSEDIIDREDREMIDAGETRKDRTRRLMDVIVMRGERSFPVFIQALQSRGYRDLAMKLLETRCMYQDVDKEERKEDLSKQMELLIQRINTIESEVKMKMVTKKETVSLSIDIKSLSLKVQTISCTLLQIEELSRLSKSTEVTISELKDQLKAKDKLLELARGQIYELESKLDNLEAENALLRSDVKRQDKQLRTLRRAIEDEKLRNEKLRKQAEEDRMRNETMFHYHEKLFEEMAKQQDRIIKEREEDKAQMQALERRLDQQKRQKKNVGKRNIVPRNRMEENKK
ncbi:calponin homology domain-containing protein DDB_G0272472-like [Haliotis asinina]|uniref:calponin homology domain-containing protein DDB_G0272472-like n=1 Tax=Haliotis asinina TaxID=109174 RepID=UPI0035322C84